MKSRCSSEQHNKTNLFPFVLNETVPTKDCSELLGVTFDSKLSFGQHLHRTSVRAHQRLHFLRKAAISVGQQGPALQFTRGLSCPLWSTALLFGLVRRQHITASKPERSVSLVRQLLWKHCTPVGQLLQLCICSNSGTQH